MGVGDLRNVLDINFIIFHNSSHSTLRGGGGGGECGDDKSCGKLYWIFS